MLRTHVKLELKYNDLIIQLMKNSPYLIMLLSTLSVVVTILKLTSVYTQENSTDSRTLKFHAIQHEQSDSSITF